MLSFSTLKPKLRVSLKSAEMVISTRLGVYDLHPGCQCPKVFDFIVSRQLTPKGLTCSNVT